MTKNTDITQSFRPQGTIEMTQAVRLPSFLIHCSCVALHTQPFSSAVRLSAICSVRFCSIYDKNIHVNDFSVEDFRLCCVGLLDK